MAINNVVEREYKSSSLLYFSDDFGKYKQTESYIHTYLENLFGYGNINITDLAGDFFKYNRLKFCYSDCTLSIHSPVTNWGLNIYLQ